MTVALAARAATGAATLATTLLAATTLLRARLLFLALLVLRVLLARLVVHVLPTLLLSALVLTTGVLATLHLIAHNTLAIESGRRKPKRLGGLGLSDQVHFRASASTDVQPQLTLSAPQK